jgi:hypothetical protein
MVKRRVDATKCNGLQHPLPQRGLSARQERVAELLASGTSVTDAAGQVGVDRSTISRWHADPDFVCAVNTRQSEIWFGTLSRLRMLTGKALDVLDSTLDDVANPNRLKAALEILRTLRPLSLAPSGPVDPDRMVAGLVDERERLFISPLQRLMLDQHDDRPSKVELTAQIWHERKQAAASEPV